MKTVPTSPKTYTFSDVVRVAERTPATVNAWLKNKVLFADVVDGQGRGTHRRFSFHNLILTRVIALLHEYGLPPTKLQMAAATLVRALIRLLETDNPHADTWADILDPSTRSHRGWLFLVQSESVNKEFEVVVGKGTASINMDRYGVGCVVINVGQAVAEVERLTGHNYFSADDRPEVVADQTKTPRRVSAARKTTSGRSRGRRTSG